MQHDSNVTGIRIFGGKIDIAKGVALTQQLEATIIEPHAIDDLISLQDFINEEHGLRGVAQVERRSPEEGTLGSALELVNIALVPGGAVTILSATLIAWIRQRRSNFSLRIKRANGSEIEIKAERIKLADTSQLRQIASDVSAAIDEDGSPDEPAIG